MLLTDFILLDHDEFAVFRNFKASKFGNALGRNGNGFYAPSPIVLPEGFLDLFLFLGIAEIATFLDEGRLHVIIDLFGDNKVAVCEQPEPKSEVFEIRLFMAAISTSAVSSITMVELPAPTP